MNPLRLYGMKSLHDLCSQQASTIWKEQDVGRPFHEVSASIKQAAPAFSGWLRVKRSAPPGIMV
jgi:hypothetical protein